jgi:N-glycosylase/DNA lyase
MYDDWAKVDPVFDGVREQFAGVRMLRQDPVENVFSFICSSNNNIQRLPPKHGSFFVANMQRFDFFRISGMVENLCLNYGQRVCEYNGKPFYRFPFLEELAQDGVDQRCRSVSCILLFHGLNDFFFF